MMTTLTRTPQRLMLLPSDLVGLGVAALFVLALAGAILLAPFAGSGAGPTPAAAPVERNVPGGDPVAFARAHAAGRAAQPPVFVDPRLAPGLVPMGPIGGPQKLLPQ